MTLLLALLVQGSCGVAVPRARAPARARVSALLTAAPLVAPIADARVAPPISPLFPSSDVLAYDYRSGEKVVFKKRNAGTPAPPLNADPTGAPPSPPAFIAPAPPPPPPPMPTASAGDSAADLRAKAQAARTDGAAQASALTRAADDQAAALTRSEGAKADALELAAQRAYDAAAARERTARSELKSAEGKADSLAAELAATEKERDATPFYRLGKKAELKDRAAALSEQTRAANGAVKAAAKASTDASSAVSKETGSLAKARSEAAKVRDNASAKAAAIRAEAAKRAAKATASAEGAAAKLDRAAAALE
ncbi:hypothetical protein KFE25_012016 [Diacronema lutheri]|uniref:Uncharacterized protein n=1 Tax=Diacronema lutheri TaxID=2081491 RepID=A0A8J5X7Q5_DIALT|nr:hypothetical protein KFE25_012016 [Diacronema lutheri]